MGNWTERIAMPLEQEMAEPLTGHHDQRWFLVTRETLLALAQARAKYAEELQEVP